MPLNPNIITATRPVSLPNAQEMMQLSNLSLQRQGLQGQLAASQKAAADQATLASLYKKNVRPDGTIDNAAMTTDLANAGLGSQIPDYQKGATAQATADTEGQTKALELQQKRVGVVNNTLSTLLSNPNVTHQDVISAISGLVDQGVIDQKMGGDMVRQLPGPNQLRPFLIQKAMETMDASKRLEAMLPKAGQIDTGGQLQLGTTDPQTGAFTTAQTIDKTATPGQKLAAETSREKGARVAFTDEEGNLMAALAERGISLPAGMRSREQMKSTFASLLSRHPDMSADEIAEGVATGQINIKGETKEVQTAAAQAGKVAVAVNELKTFGPNVLAASAKIPRGNFVPWNKLKNMANTAISDPNLLAFKVQMQSLNNAYDAVAARGGTDMDKRAHIHELFDTANSPEAVDALIKAVNIEADSALEAAHKAARRQGGTNFTPTTGHGTGAVDSTTPSGATVSNW